MTTTSSSVEVQAQNGRRTAKNNNPPADLKLALLEQDAAWAYERIFEAGEELLRVLQRRRHDLDTTPIHVVDDGLARPMGATQAFDYVTCEYTDSLLQHAYAHRKHNNKNWQKHLPNTVSLIKMIHKWREIIATAVEGSPWETAYQ